MYHEQGNMTSLWYVQIIIKVKKVDQFKAPALFLIAILVDRAEAEDFFHCFSCDLSNQGILLLKSHKDS